MAKLQEQIIILKVSRLLKDADQEQPLLSDEALTSLEAVVQELAGNNTLVEIASE